MKEIYSREQIRVANVQRFTNASFVPSRLIVNKIKASRFTLAGLGFEVLQPVIYIMRLDPAKNNRGTKPEQNRRSLSAESSLLRSKFTGRPIGIPVRITDLAAQQSTARTVVRRSRQIDSRELNPRVSSPEHLRVARPVAGLFVELSVWNRN